MNHPISGHVKSWQDWTVSQSHYLYCRSRKLEEKERIEKVSQHGDNVRRPVFYSTGSLHRKRAAKTFCPPPARWFPFPRCWSWWPGRVSPSPPSWGGHSPDGRSLCAPAASEIHRHGVYTRHNNSIRSILHNIRFSFPEQENNTRQMFWSRESLPMNLEQHIMHSMCMDLSVYRIIMPTSLILQSHQVKKEDGRVKKVTNDLSNEVKRKK